MEKDQKKIGMLMSVYMGFVMSIFMTVTGVCVGMLPNVLKHRIPPQAMISSLISGFFISFAISMMIGFVVPMKTITDSATKNMKPGMGKRCFETLISDAIYTPVISLVMVAFAYMSNNKNGEGGPTYLMMLIPSLIACFIVGYIIIFLVQPAILKHLMKRFGKGEGPKGPGPINKP